MKPAWRDDYRSWGRVVAAKHLVARPRDLEDVIETMRQREGRPVLAYGCGRSYGDVALNPMGLLVDCRSLDRFIAFDPDRGVLTCEAGVQLADILAVICRSEAGGGGWMLPVSPGTRFVTVGGAIANDVHGKNHHRFGTFGRHVLSLDLLRSDGSVWVCSAEQNGEMFAATIGGLGLTGVILRATIQLRRVTGLAVELEDIRFSSLEEFFSLAGESDREWEYTAAWVDCASSGRSAGRGIFSRARHVDGVATAPPDRQVRFTVPMDIGVSLVNKYSVKAFNALYWRKSLAGGHAPRVGSYAPILYPLDAIGCWNWLYGRHGFYQFQCVVPSAQAVPALRELLRTIAESGEGSMLAVLKVFGDAGSPGLLSFPMSGTTLALDFPARRETLSLLSRLETIVVEASGRLYPAKDGVMKPETFAAGFRQLDRYIPMLDPHMSSAFARRVCLVPEGDRPS